MTPGQRAADENDDEGVVRHWHGRQRRLVLILFIAKLDVMGHLCFCSGTEVVIVTICCFLHFRRTFDSAEHVCQVAAGASLTTSHSIIPDHSLLVHFHCYQLVSVAPSYSSNHGFQEEGNGQGPAGDHCSVPAAAATATRPSGSARCGACPIK